jgi:hypothetical protein
MTANALAHHRLDVAAMWFQRAVVAVAELAYRYPGESVVRRRDARTEVLLATSGGTAEAGPAPHPRFFSGRLRPGIAAFDREIGRYGDTVSFGGVIGRVIAAWPSFALVGSYEILMQAARSRRLGPRQSASAAAGRESAAPTRGQR